MCSILPPLSNGDIAYTELTGTSVGFMGMATYSCNTGYGLSGGDIIRTCVGAAGGPGEWSGTAPTCEGICY